MQITSSFRVLGILLMLFSITLLPPIGVGLLYHDGTEEAFILAMIATILIGFSLWFPLRNKTEKLRTRDGFIIVVLFWSTLCLVGALPIYFIQSPSISLIDSIFESVSGLTTTGSTVLTNIDILPKAILYYRQQLQFLGGLGIIVLAVAILPMLKVGGAQLFRAEVTGPVTDDKLTPRIAETAKALWYIYVGLTIACLFAYWLAGMDLFDALGYAFSTVSTGGYAPHQDSLGFYESHTIKLIATVFMILGGINFGLHFIAVKRVSLKHYFLDEEIKMFLLTILFITGVVFIILWLTEFHINLTDSFVNALFQVTSVVSTTGLTIESFDTWPGLAPILIMVGGLIGGCAGSTTGGIKILRILLLFKQSFREFKRLIHPHGSFPIKLHNQSVPPRVIDAVWGFLGIYLLMFVILLLGLMATGLDFFTAYSSSIASLSNIGPGLGETFDSFANVSTSAKVMLSFGMLVGRLEVFTVIVLFFPMFWRK